MTKTIFFFANKYELLLRSFGGGKTYFPNSKLNIDSPLRKGVRGISKNPAKLCISIFFSDFLTNFSDKFSIASAQISHLEFSVAIIFPHGISIDIAELPHKFIELKSTSKETLLRVREIARKFFSIFI